MQTEDSQFSPVPLTDAELDRLSATLARFGNDRAMNVEELDGFLAALVCGPDLVLPSEFLSEICGCDLHVEGAAVDRRNYRTFCH